ncbi:hypothetical protein Naga_100009g79 [Nannochloropsis gaditana]|uniref:Uncharacterized protein n=1 Tax=Nannochloropsis gaditana TaxID=72520 RepID=W7TR16_9STRA|nr:hypothetical protein Naga_100009g79 [Nannochloropsis gaditana]
MMMMMMILKIEVTFSAGTERSHTGNGLDTSRQPVATRICAENSGNTNDDKHTLSTFSDASFLRGKADGEEKSQHYDARCCYALFYLLFSCVQNIPHFNIGGGTGFCKTDTRLSQIGTFLVSTTGLRSKKHEKITDSEREELIDDGLRRLGRHTRFAARVTRVVVDCEGFILVIVTLTILSLSICLGSIERCGDTESIQRKDSELLKQYVIHCTCQGCLRDSRVVREET